MGLSLTQSDIDGFDLICVSLVLFSSKLVKQTSVTQNHSVERVPRDQKCRVRIHLEKCSLTQKSLKQIQHLKMNKRCSIDNILPVVRECAPSCQKCIYCYDLQEQ